jgi:hypothetical protein
MMRILCSPLSLNASYSVASRVVIWTRLRDGYGVTCKSGRSSPPKDALLRIDLTLKSFCCSPQRIFYNRLRSDLS